MVRLARRDKSLFAVFSERGTREGHIDFSVFRGKRQTLTYLYPGKVRAKASSSFNPCRSTMGPTKSPDSSHDKANSPGASTDSRIGSWNRYGFRAFVSLLAIALFAVTTLHAERFAFTSKERVPHKSNVQGQDDCDCYSSRKGCCQRMALHVHKMDTILIRQQFASFHLRVRKEQVSNIRLSDIDDSIDYRHIVLVRNMHEAIVSGFLYHRSGRECWLDINGRPYRDDAAIKLYVIPWEDSIRAGRFNLTYPPGKGRNLCEYLAQENEKDGMAVYIATGLNSWYLPLNEYFEEEKRREDRDGFPKSKFFCYEDASDPERKEGVFNDMIDWLFPSGHNFTYSAAQSNATYVGGHSTSHDTTLRDSLRNLVERLDEEVFQHALATIQANILCGE